MRINRLYRKGNNVLVEFESGERIKLNYEVVVKSGLRKNDTLSDEDLRTLERRNELYLVEQSAFRLLQRRNHSVKELKDKLKKKKFRAELIDQAVISLRERNYIDENSFVEDFIREKFFMRKNGPNKIKAQLIQKGISSDIIKTHLERLVSDDDSYENAMAIALKKLSFLKESDSVKIKQKLFSFLSGRGYGSDVIYKVFTGLDL